MRSIITLLVTLLVSTFFNSCSAADMSLFIGKWKLVEAYDEQREPVTLPEGAFFMELKPPDEDDNSDNANVLNAFIKIGNNLRSRITLDENSASASSPDQPTSITMGPIMSTMMMPPEPLFQLETFLSNILPQMDSIQTAAIDGVTTTLTLSGVGKIVYEKA